jgi:hypothetical protein
MSQTPDEANAKPTIAVKHEESLELLKAFLMIKDPTLRAEIISTVKKTACDQKREFFSSRYHAVRRRNF